MLNENGVVKYDVPVRVDSLEWAFSHIGCNALVLNELGNESLNIIAYATKQEYNKELEALWETTPNSVIFQNIDEREINSIDTI